MTTIVEPELRDPEEKKTDGRSSFSPQPATFHTIDDCTLSSLTDDPRIIEGVDSDPKHWTGIYTGPLSGTRIHTSPAKFKRIEDHGTSDLMGRQTASKLLLDHIVRDHPAAAKSRLVHRYSLYALFGRCIDERSMKLVISQSVLQWIAGRRFYGNYWSTRVLQEIRQAISGFRYRDHFFNGNSSESLYRRIESSGLSKSVVALARRERRQALSGERVHLFERDGIECGDVFQSGHAALMRRQVKQQLDRHLILAPSRTSACIWLRMNDRPAALFDRVRRHVHEARQALHEKDIIVTNKHGKRNRRAEDRLRHYYFDVLQSIEDQPQQFYTFSRRGRTDRVFPCNAGILSLPSDLRRILCQDFFEIDLRSAHLLIAAALWNAPETLNRLTDDSYNVWVDLMDHLGEGGLGKTSARYGEIKSALKEAVYSTVYGMPEPSIAGQFTRAMKDELGKDAGVRLRRHSIIKELLSSREEMMRSIALNGRMRTPTGIRAVVSRFDDRDVASVMATAAQAHEQHLMSVILQFEQAQLETGVDDFRVVAWIHDGSYVDFARPEDKHDIVDTGSNRIVDHLQTLVTMRGRDWNVPAFFEAAPVFAKRR